MAKLEPLTCPNCGGQVQAPPGATRATCPFCGTTFAVDIKNAEANLYIADQQEQARQKAALGQERNEFYNQYMTFSNEVDGLDDEVLRLRSARQDANTRARLKEIMARRAECVQEMSALQVEIAKRDGVIHPGMSTPLPAVPAIQAARRPHRIIGCLGVLVLLIAAALLYSALSKNKAITSPAPAGLPVTLPMPTISSAMRTQLVAAVTATASALQAPPISGYYYAKETSHSVTYFAQPFQRLGGVSALGYPITEAFIQQALPPDDRESRWVQYFEKAVIEYHPELPEGQKYQPARLGALRLQQKYPGVTPAAQTLPGPNSYRFAETGYTVTDPFLTLWHSGGEVARFGYPISTPFREKSEADGNSYIVQYFERAVMEYHPDSPPPYDVQLTAVGSMRLKQLYPGGAPAEAPVDEKKTP